MGGGILVRNLDGGVFVVPVNGTIGVSELKSHVEARTGVPVAWQRLRANGVELCDARHSNGSVSSSLVVELLLRVDGGKGGFGSLLRGGPAGVVQKKTTNFGACRDLSGRRLRDAQNEKKLQKWMEESTERELEQKALEFIKQQERNAKKQVDMSKFIEEDKLLTATVEEALEHGLKAAATAAATDLDAKAKKRRIGEGDEDSKLSKRRRLWDDAEFAASDDDEDEHAIIGATTSTSTSSTSSSPESSSTSTSSPPPEHSEPTESSSSSSSSDSSATRAAAISDIVVEQYASVAELEALGAEVLKFALKLRDLPCGGSVTQRAERLFAIRNQDPSKWKALTKPKSKRAKKAKK